ncbi:hemoglobin [Haloferula luteola]|uniref:Hemoglobin n=1 Tax=Haloferula luteola TaxID=595692 RepID=A0A840VBY2_9BACT|nr:globin [Haloferula luteola]MBB5352178.1 hemoglobin [Haloferula luteola]
METLEQVVARELDREGLDALVAAFYRRVPGDDLLGPMYPSSDLEGAEERLRDFLKFRLLGDPMYQLKRGHPRLRMRHMPFSIGEAERDRWLSLMESAMEETKVSAEAQRVLVPFFAQVADFMRNQ